MNNATKVFFANLDAYVIKSKHQRLYIAVRLQTIGYPDHFSGITSRV